MSMMKELYDKVATDLILQEKFLEIMGGAEAAGGDVTRQKLIDFAKDAGYEVTLDEMKDFFQEKIDESKEGALSEAELDMVAGGKGTNAFTGLFSKLGSQGNKWINDPGGMLGFTLGLHNFGL